MRDLADPPPKKLLSEYPDQIDGFERLGQVYEARGEKQVADYYYQKAADFAKTMPGFDQESVETESCRGGRGMGCREWSGKNNHYQDKSL